MALIKFKQGLQNAYDVAKKDLSTAYFCTDSQRFFLGEVEYSRPVKHGSSLPDGFNPPNSFYVVDNDDGSRSLHYSEDGRIWTMVSLIPAEVSGGVFGNNESTKLTHGGELTVPKITIDSHGFVTAASDQKLTLPSASVDTAETLVFD